MTSFPDRMRIDEQAICHRLIDAVLLVDEAHLEIQVRDGVEIDVLQPYTREHALIQRATGSTDITLWEVREAESGVNAPVLVFVLVHGNGPDVITDVLANAATKELSDRLVRHATES